MSIAQSPTKPNSQNHPEISMRPLQRHSLSRRSAFTLLFLFTQLRGRLDPGCHEDVELLDAIDRFEAQVDVACRPIPRAT